MDGVEDLEEDVGEAAAHAAGGEFEALGEQLGDFLDRDAAGEFAGFGAAHAVADGEDKVT